MKNNSNEILSLKQRIFITSFILVFSLIILIPIYIDSQYDINVLKILAIFWITDLGIFAPIIFYKKFLKLSFSKIRTLASYEYTSKVLLIYMVICLLDMILILDIINLHKLILLLSIPFIIPCLALLCRTNIFSDSNCIVNDEIIFGYHPGYALLSLILGIIGFYQFYLVAKGYEYIITLLIFQLIFIIPDLFNKILPFEIREIKGSVLFISSVIVCYTLYFCVINTFSLNNITFNIVIKIVLVIIFFIGISKIRNR